MHKEDYSRPKHEPFPRDLAAMIACKASIMAARFEDQAIHSMVRDAQRALDRGVTVSDIARDMQLPPANAKKTRKTEKQQKT
ncbi:hypothetical protein [Pseudomonas psychrophila]|uniref:hypothetical protein n=1 Tax=Pseudomonas psychrophila TaxID=122355 RepID=UPI0003167E96|nr:hypothetical protein [Pseudomonas psychrophila]